MQQHEIHHFLERYFRANQCEIVEKGDGFLTVQLTVDLDKELMNRPFYWHYIEKTGGTPAPAKLTLITKQTKETEKLNGERLYFGSPRLHQIFQSTQKQGRYIRLFENIQPSGQQFVPLHPWLCLNVKVSYQCDRKRDFLVSLGLHLISGTIVDQFHQRIEQIRLTPKIPDFCFTMSPLIKPQSGILRLEQHVRNMIAKDDHSWADEALKRWEEDVVLLDHFYEEVDDKPECYYIEKQAIEEQYKPKILVSIINGGLFYLQPRSPS